LDLSAREIEPPLGGYLVPMGNERGNSCSVKETQRGAGREGKGPIWEKRGGKDKNLRKKQQKKREYEIRKMTGGKKSKKQRTRKGPKVSMGTTK